MSRIPTVEEFVVHGKPLEYWKNNASEDYMKTPISVLKYITTLEEASLEVAKMHVGYALKEVIEKAFIIIDGNSYEDIKLDKDSILNAYPLDNIK